MEKAKEIQILQSLKGDTYFHQFFTSEDIDEMCENIKKDFAIESGIEKLNACGKLVQAQQNVKELNETINRYAEELEETQAQLKKASEFIADQSAFPYEEQCRAKAIELMGERGYVKYILSKDFDLTQEDKQLIAKLLA